MRLSLFPLSAVFLILLTAIAPASAKAENFCTIELGDINGDGRFDVAIRAQAPRSISAKSVAYLFFGEPPSELSHASLQASASIILRGMEAEAFRCPWPRPRNFRQALRQSKPVPATAPRTTRYRMIDLTPLSPGQYLVATAISSQGFVVGRFYNTDGEEHAFVYDGTTLHDLGTLGGHFSDARSVNRNGEIVGYSLTGATDNFGLVHEAFSVLSSQMRGLGTRWSSAAKINDHSQIVGEARLTPEADAYQAVLFENGSIQYLGGLGGANSFASSLNNRGAIVGEAETVTKSRTVRGRRYQSVHAFLYQDGGMQDIGSLGFPCYIDGGYEQCDDHSVATDINVRGQVVGFSSTDEGQTRAFVRQPEGGLQNLGTLDDAASFAYAINDSVQIVGTLAGQNAYAPFIFENGRLHDLRQLIDRDGNEALPWGASDINNFGQIVGTNHLLLPIYDHITTKKPLVLPMPVGRALQISWWTQRGSTTSCATLQIQLRVQTSYDTGWMPVSVINSCSTSENWKRVILSLPGKSSGASTVTVRLKSISGANSPTIYLRHIGS